MMGATMSDSTSDSNSGQPTAARTSVPPGACDCHMHVFDGPFPPDTTVPFAAPQATVAQYRQMQATLGLQRVVVVQANGYRFDNGHVLAALAELGDAARGVVVVAPDTAEAELARLTALGVRGVRLHMLPGGALGWPALAEVAARVRPFGWHVQVQFDGHSLPEHLADLEALPVDCVIDHLGKFLGNGPPAPDAPAARALLRLLDRGRCWVKLSGPYESSRLPAPGYADVLPLARALVATHPERCVWASNWPHPMRDPRPSDAALLDLLQAWADDDATRRRILVDNPARLYGFGPVPPTPASPARTPGTT